MRHARRSRMLPMRRRQVPIGWSPVGPSRRVMPGTISAADYDAAMRRRSGRGAVIGSATGIIAGADVGAFSRAAHSLSVGAPIAPRDAEAMARVLQQHGYWPRSWGRR